MSVKIQKTQSVTLTNATLGWGSEIVELLVNNDVRFLLTKTRKTVFQLEKKGGNLT